MAHASTAFPYNLRFVTLGSAADLCIAAPLAEGDTSPDANTGPGRIGIYFDRTPGLEKLSAVVLGTETFFVDTSGIEALEVRSASHTLVGYNDTASYMGLARFGGTTSRIRAGYGTDGTQADTGLTISVRNAGDVDVDAVTISSAGIVSFAVTPVITGLTPNTVLIANGSSQIANALPMTDGQLLIGSTGVAPTVANLIAGANVTILNGAGSITISATGGTGSPGGVDTNVQYNNVGGFAGSSNFTWNNGTNTLTITGVTSSAQVIATATVSSPLGTAAAPTYIFTGDADTGLFSPGANQVGVTTSGISRWVVSDTAVTSFVIGVFPATTVANASIRLPHGTAPSAPVDGDVWTTTAGLFSRINGATVGPYGAGGSGTVTSVALAAPAIFSVSGSPVTLSGTLTLGLVSQAANTVWAAPDGVGGNPSFRTLVSADIPTLAQSKITGLVTDLSNRLLISGGTLTGLLVTVATSAPNAGLRLPHGTAPSAPVNGDLWTTTAGVFARINGATVGPYGAGMGSGTVTSVALAAPGIFSVSGSPVTVSGTLTLGLVSQSMNTVWAAPDGVGGNPSFRTLVSADIPTLAQSKITSLVTDLSNRLQLGGGTLTGLLITAAPTAPSSGFRLPHGTAPSAPVDGDFWTTTVGVFSRINGTTVQLATGGLSGSGTSGRIAYWSGSATLTSEAGFAYNDATNTLTVEKGSIGAISMQVATDTAAFDGVTSPALFVSSGNVGADIYPGAYGHLVLAPRNNAARYVSIWNGSPLVESARFSPTDINMYLPLIASTTIAAGTTIRAGDGTNTLPAFSFNSQTNMGMYNAGSNQLGLATGGTAQMVLSAGSVVVTPRLEARVAATTYSSTTTIVRLNRLRARISTAGITLSLWATPQDGDIVVIRNSSSGSATVGRNGENIDGVASDFTLAAGESIELTYFTGTGWWGF